MSEVWNQIIMSASLKAGLNIAHDAAAYNDPAEATKQFELFKSLGIFNYRVNNPLWDTEVANLPFRAKLEAVVTMGKTYGYVSYGYTMNGQQMTSTSWNNMASSIIAMALRANPSMVTLGNEKDLRLGTKSITSITRSGSTATATATAHGLVNGELITIAGANQSEYNGDFNITVTDADHFTYTVTGTPATPATGTLTQKLTQTALMNRQIQLAVDLRTAGYTGDIGVVITTNVYALWKANVANWTGKLYLGVNIYNTLAAFKSQVDDMEANLPDLCWIPEFNTNNSGMSAWATVAAAEEDVMARLNYVESKSHIIKHFVFLYAVDDSTEQLKWAMYRTGLAIETHLFRSIVHDRQVIAGPSTTPRYAIDMRKSYIESPYAIDMTGAGGAEIVLDTENMFAGSFYIASWMKLAGVNGNFQTWVAKRNAYAANQMMFSAAFDSVTGKLNVDTVTSFVPFQYSVPFNVWVLMMWVHDVAGGHELLYQDGVLVSTQGPATLGTKTDAILTLGANQATPQDILNGKLSRTLIGQGVPSTEEARLIYTRFQPFGTLKRYFKLDEGTGLVVTDYSGNDMHGAIVGAAAYTTDTPYPSRKPANL